MSGSRSTDEVKRKHWGARVGVSDGGLSITDRQNPPGEHTVQDCWPWGGSPMPGHLSSPAPPGRSGGLCFWCLWQVWVCVGEGHPGPPRRPFPLFPGWGGEGWLCPTPQLTEGNLCTHLLPRGCGWLQAWRRQGPRSAESEEGGHALGPPVTRAQPGSPQPEAAGMTGLSTLLQQGLQAA